MDPFHGRGHRGPVCFIDSVSRIRYTLGLKSKILLKALTKLGACWYPTRCEISLIVMFVDRNRWAAPSRRRFTSSSLRFRRVCSLNRWLSRDPLNFTSCASSAMLWNCPRSMARTTFRTRGSRKFVWVINLAEDFPPPVLPVRGFIVYTR